MSWAPDDGTLSKVLIGASGLMFGAAGAVSSYFNDIVAGRLTFSLAKLVMLIVIGGTIGSVATSILLDYGVHPAVAGGLAAAFAACHEYVFKAAAIFVEKWMRISK